MAEFIKKIKTLNNEIIIKLLHERFNNAQTQNDTKLLTVSFVFYIENNIEIALCYWFNP